MKLTKTGIIKRFVSIVVLICSLLLLVPMAFTSSGSVDQLEEAPQNTISHVRIGMKYSQTAVDKYSFTTEYGIEYGVQNKYTHEFVPVGAREENYWTVEDDDGNYYVKVSYFVVGDKIYAKNDEIISKLGEIFGEDEDPVFLQYNSDGMSEVRVGVFGSKIDGEEYIAAVNEKLKYYNANLISDYKLYFEMATVQCNNSCVRLVCGDENVCGYVQNDDDWAFGVRAIQPENGEIGYICEDGKIYKGVFEFRKLFGGSYNEKIGVINVVDIEQYVAACMSYEIYPSWKHESHQMFAIVVRTYIYGQTVRHKSWDFNLCTTTHCQVYRGFDRVNASLLTAAEETAGLVVVSAEGQLAQIYYYASAGGCNVSGPEAWGGSNYSYSKAVAAPWETYMSPLYVSRSKWKVEYSPYQLYLQIKDTCTELEGSVAKIETEYCTNSPFVYSITFTDIYGNKSTVDHSNNVAVLLGLNSANFVVGKAGQTVERVIYSLDCFDSIYYEDDEAYDVLGYQGSDVYGVTSIGDVLLTGENFEIVGSNGSAFKNIFDYRVQIITSGGTNWLTKDGLPDVLNAKTITERVEVELSGNDGSFVFDGMGWGHGVGLSQYGSNDMIALGYSPETVLRYYLPGTQVMGVNLLDK